MKKSGYVYQKIVDESICGQLPVESTERRSAYVIHSSDNVYSCDPDTVRPRNVWIQMIIH